MIIYRISRLLFFPLLCLMFSNSVQLSASCCSSLPARYSTPNQPADGMVWIPGGDFTMGSDTLDSKADEKPPHRVKVEGFLDGFHSCDE